MDIKIPPLRIKMMLESIPLKSRIVVWRLAVWLHVDNQTDNDKTSKRRRAHEETHKDIMYRFARLTRDDRCQKAVFMCIHVLIY